MVFLLFTIAFVAAAGSFVLEHKRYDVPVGTKTIVLSSDDDEKSSKLDNIPGEQEQPDDQDKTTSYMMVTTPRAATYSPSYRDSQADTFTADDFCRHAGRA